MSGVGRGSISLVSHLSSWTLTSISGFSSALAHVLQRSLASRSQTRYLPALPCIPDPFILLMPSQSSSPSSPSRVPLFLVSPSGTLLKVHACTCVLAVHRGTLPSPTTRALCVRALHRLTMRRRYPCLLEGKKPHLQTIVQPCAAAETLTRRAGPALLRACRSPRRRGGVSSLLCPFQDACGMLQHVWQDKGCQRSDGFEALQGSRKGLGACDTEATLLTCALGFHMLTGMRGCHSKRTQIERRGLGGPGQGQWPRAPGPRGSDPGLGPGPPGLCRRCYGRLHCFCDRSLRRSARLCCYSG